MLLHGATCSELPSNISTRLIFTRCMKCTGVMFHCVGTNLLIQFLLVFFLLFLYLSLSLFIVLGVGEGAHTVSYTGGGGGGGKGGIINPCVLSGFYSWSNFFVTFPKIFLFLLNFGILSRRSLMSWFTTRWRPGVKIMKVKKKEN